VILPGNRKVCVKFIEDLMTFLAGIHYIVTHYL